MSNNLRFLAMLFAFICVAAPTAQPLSAYTNPEPSRDAGQAPAQNSAEIPGLAKTYKPGKPGTVVITVGPSKIRQRQIDTLVDLMARTKRTPASTCVTVKLARNFVATPT